MRLEINTSGRWKVLGDVDPEQLDQVRDACELLVNLSKPKCVAFQLTDKQGAVMMRVDTLGPRGIEPAQWRSRQITRPAWLDRAPPPDIPPQMPPPDSDPAPTDDRPILDNQGNA